MFILHTILLTLLRRICLKSNLYPLVISVIMLVFGLTLPLPDQVIMRWFVVLTFESVDKILWYCHSNETSSVVFSHGTIYLICSSNFWVCGWIPIVWPFRWKLFSRTIAWCYLVLGLYKRKFGICGEFSLWPLFGVKRLSSDIFKRNKMLFPVKAQKDRSCFAVAQHVLPSISLLLDDFPLNNQRAH